MTSKTRKENQIGFTASRGSVRFADEKCRCIWNIKHLQGRSFTVIATLGKLPWMCTVCNKGLLSRTEGADREVMELKETFLSKESGYSEMKGSETWVCQNNFLWVLAHLLHSSGFSMNGCTTESAAFPSQATMKGQRIKLRRWHVTTLSWKGIHFQSDSFSIHKDAVSLGFSSCLKNVSFFNGDIFLPFKE